MVLKSNMYEETFQITGRRNQRNSWAWYSCLARQPGPGTEGRVNEMASLQVRRTANVSRTKTKLFVLAHWTFDHLLVGISTSVYAEFIFSPVPKLFPASTTHRLDIQRPTRKLLPPCATLYWESFHAPLPCWSF